MNKFIADDIKMTYDDVLLCPSESLTSRQDANTCQYMDKIGLVEHPIIAANMDSIASDALLKSSLDRGGIAIGHRYKSFESRYANHEGSRFFVSIGVSEEEINMAVRAAVKKPGLNFCIDIAHGHSQRVYEAIRRIKDASNKSIIIAGNIATVSGFYALAESGADIIKVGVGPGSHCTTRLVTGCGYPQLSAILEICDARKRLDRYVPIIADGGIRNSGDIVKAIAAGADLVMTGSLFSGCTEAPGEIVDINGRKCKQYRGMASREAQIGWFGRDVITPEGETSFVDVKPSYEEILKSLIGGLKSGMSYLGCATIEDLQNKARFIRVSSNTLIENHPHGKQ